MGKQALSESLGGKVSLKTYYYINLLGLMSCFVFLISNICMLFLFVFCFVVLV